MLRKPLKNFGQCPISSTLNKIRLPRIVIFRYIMAPESSKNILHVNVRKNKQLKGIKKNKNVKKHNKICDIFHANFYTQSGTPYFF